MDFNNTGPRVPFKMTCALTTGGSKHSLSSYSVRKAEEHLMCLYLFTMHPNKLNKEDEMHHIHISNHQY